MESTTLVTLLFGFALGMQHALDPDHVVAISTILSQNRHPIRAVQSGVIWGLGHTATLCLTGLAVILFKFSIPYQLALSMEFLVGMLLFVMGTQLLWKHHRMRVHAHHHRHSGEIPGHQHYHSHSRAAGHRHPHQMGHFKSLVMGMIHGLAGSTALMLLVLGIFQSPIEGMAYVLLFGIGSVLGMMVVSTLIGLPFALSYRRFTSLDRPIQLLAGAVSIALGIIVMVNIGINI